MTVIVQNRMDALLREIDALPPTPQILPKLQGLLRRPDTDLRDLRDLIRVDAGLAAQIIRAANSSLYGASAPAESLEDALNRIGFRETYRITSYFCSREVLNEALPLYGMKQAEFLQQSVIAALLMLEFGRRLQRHDSEALYTVGLLHGIGRVVINRYFLSKGISLYDHPEDGVSAEFSEDQIHAIVGFTFAEIGAELLRSWKFSEPVVECISLQLEPTVLGHAGDTVRLLKLANATVPTIFQASVNDALSEDLPCDETLSATGLSADAYKLSMLRALTEFTKVRKLLG